MKGLNDQEIHINIDFRTILTIKYLSI